MQAFEHAASFSLSGTESCGEHYTTETFQFQVLVPWRTLGSLNGEQDGLKPVLFV